MAASDIVINGAREHNLRDISLSLPRNQLICLTGVSGSGKSSLAFDTVYAEGQRRYVESLSTFARQFLGQMPKPDVDFIGGLSPSISIAQKASGQNPRSTVGTITEIYDYLRVLYARVGQGHCPQCDRQITAQSREQIIERISELPVGTKYSILAPVVRAQKGEHRDLFDDLLKQGFVRARADGRLVQLTDDLHLDRQMRHNIEVVIDRLTAGPNVRSRLAEAVELALRLGGGNLLVSQEGSSGAAAGTTQPVKAAIKKGKRSKSQQPDEAEAANDLADEDDEQRLPPTSTRSEDAPSDLHLSAHYACTHCGLSFEPPSPQMFSFNSPQGMCQDCDGLGEIYGFDVNLLIPNPGRSFKQGCFELIGPWKELGRWRKHIYQGVSDTLEHKYGLGPGDLLETAWEEVSPELQKLLLWGTGDLHITYSWKAGPTEHKYGGKFEGILPELLSKYRGSKSKMQQRQLEKYMSVVGCGTCGGRRLNAQARSVMLTSKDARFADSPRKSLPAVADLSISEAVDFFSELELDKTSQTIAAEALKEIRGRLGFLLGVGLDYLTLARTAPTLSGGETQRIRLAGQVGCGLVGVLYILDEPSIGLHPRDNDRLLETLTRLRDLGNTVVVVEHDEDTMRAADHLVDFGPGPGVRGGEVVASGPVKSLTDEPRSVTGQFLSGERKIEIPAERRQPQGPLLKIVSASHNNLKGVDVEIPLGLFVCVTGVSGSGKSSLVNDILVEALRRDLNGGDGLPGAHERIEGMEHLDKMIAIDQSPIGRTPRSNPATYIKVFDEIRKLYTQLPESKARGYKEGRFSFNVAGGRCEACEGNGSNRLEMDFLADVWVTCPVCEGHRFNRETLSVRFKGKSISEVLEMDIQQALEHFENVPHVRHKLQTLHDVGLDYLKLGQPSPTLSGGEAQRVKLARELVKRSTGRTLYLLDEPTTGLHFADIQMLLKVLQDFAQAGNTVVVVEHNLDVIKTADWVIDMGPEGGHGGGRVIASGTPEDVAKVKESYTGRALAKVLAGHNAFAGSEKSAAEHAPRPRVPQSDRIVVRGAKQHNLKEVDVEIPRDLITVCCGPSGSGKSSLAMDTIYAEGQRRYVESLSSYARQFVGQMQKPAVEHIEGLSPAIAIEQKHLGHTPRSTVGTVTEIYDYLRILFARLGQPYCPKCDIPIGTQSADEIIDKLMAEPEGTRLFLLAPLDVQVGEKHETLWADLKAQGYQRIRVDRATHPIDQPPTIDRRRKHLIEVVVDRVTIRPEGRSRIADSVEKTLALGKGLLNVAFVNEEQPEPKWRTVVHSQHNACDKCGRSFEQLTPHSFSFNSSLGWCSGCEGLGVQTGANPAALLNDPKLTLAEGAVSVWPNVELKLARFMLSALSAHAGVPLDVPFDQLTPKQRRIVFHGCDEEWIDVWSGGKKQKEGRPLFRFQYKGLYPALDEASRLSTFFRGKLEHLVGEVECSSCGGSRLRDDAAAVRLRDKTMEELCRLPLGMLFQQFDAWKPTGSERKIAGELIREVRNRLQFLVDVGLQYLTLARGAPTLSGGEAQRIRLASQVGSGLTGVLYVLDEPTIGLHPRDNARLIEALKRLRDLGNTLLLVEHDREVVAGADRLLDFGPAAGEFGGRIVARGTPGEVSEQSGSVTGPYLSGEKAVAVPTNRRMDGMSSAECRVSNEGKKPAKGTKKGKAAPAAKKPPSVSIPHSTLGNRHFLEIVGARHNNLKNVSVGIPLGALTVVTGVSGSGKSSLVEDVLYNALAKVLHRAKVTPAAHTAIRGVEQINKVIQVDQQALGNTPTSNPATFTGVFELIRQLFAALPEAKVRGYTARRFSFNVAGGRCETCEGAGQKRIEMHFLPDVWVECDVCRGQRYNAETLSVKYRGQSISDVLNMSCGKAAKLFENIPKIRKTLQTLCDVGLDYLALGQAAPTLSGGEAQRVKLAAELSRPDTGRTLYLLDEPTTGLHFDDLVKLLDVLNRLVDLGNTVVVIEHNIDVIKTADWVIDMGPEGGDEGGRLVIAGTPEDLVAHHLQWRKAQKALVSAAKKKTAKSAKGTVKKPAPTAVPLLRSHTGEVLEDVLKAGPFAERKHFNALELEAASETDLDISEVGRDTRMPWEADGRRWHTVDRVGRNGEPCRWDGRILAQVVDRIQDTGEFSPTEWNNRTVVEIAAERKADGWFMHAITGEQWLLKLKFRVARNTFRRGDPLAELELKPFNELPDLPVYGNEPRVKCKNLRPPWQEIQVAVHSLEEVDKPAFWEFIDKAIGGFRKHTEKAGQNPEDIMPWKVLGQKWHLSRKGFPPGKRVQWETDLLEELCGLLTQAAPKGQFLWNNQQVVHMLVGGQREPWATLHTKRPAAIELVLTGPKGHFALGRVAGLAAERDFVPGPEKDIIKLRFRTSDDVAQGDLARFVKEHVGKIGEKV
ncbi:MAG: excinuclease ABC subunit UvrA [Pirellulales bacterium]